GIGDSSREDPKKPRSRLADSDVGWSTVLRRTVTRHLPQLSSDNGKNYRKKNLKVSFVTLECFNFKSKVPIIEFWKFPSLFLQKYGM
ncbi:MAG: hypothetical protein AAF492_25105, partial [Verrucomicrobiota bacterium]